ncbi:unnamed protein product [Caenorhabditis bovis]|uniref:Elongator complex protein 4 n=1 Tax=Caenorhabditis bovis TaxID=2654633 RepID=A0A8S1F5I6_9PELO|nr:unnamed protein product [Caenorhabditis bovis]
MLTVGDTVQINGCSTKKRILETSSGCNAFDTVCGGALTNSSIVLIDEPRSRHYASFLVKYFVAEGVHYNHKILIVDPNADPKTGILSEIPSRKIVDEKPTGFPERKVENEEMSIAWRYDKVAKVDSALGSSSKQEATYDFSNFLKDVDAEVFTEFSFKKLYEKIEKTIRDQETHTKGGGRGGPKKNLLRIVIQNIDSILWEDRENMGRFLVFLRALLRSSYAIAYITTNSYSTNESIFRVIENCADVNVQLECFNEEEKKTFRGMGTVHGYFRLKSLPRLAALGMHCPPIMDLIFEAQSRKGFQIRIMHLPPALDEPSPSSKPCNIDF